MNLTSVICGLSFDFSSLKSLLFNPTHKKNSLNPCDRFLEYNLWKIASLKTWGFLRLKTYVKVGRKWKCIGDYFPSRFDSDTDGVVPAGVESTLKDTTHCHCIEATTLKVNLFAVVVLQTFSQLLRWWKDRDTSKVYVFKCCKKDRKHQRS